MQVEEGGVSLCMCAACARQGSAGRKDARHCSRVQLRGWMRNGGGVLRWASERLVEKRPLGLGMEELREGARNRRVPKCGPGGLQWWKVAHRGAYGLCSRCWGMADWPLCVCVCVEGVLDAEGREGLILA